MQDKEWRDRETQDDLEYVSAGQSTIGTMLQQFNKYKRDMGNKSRKKQDRSWHTSPNSEEYVPACLHRVQ
jgi:hypothetical protein